MSECSTCARLRKQLAKVKAENDQLHEGMAHYREKCNELLAKIQTKVAEQATKH